MIYPGERLENPVTDEALVFHRTSEQTDGASELTFDEQRLGAVGSETQLASPIAEHDGGDA